MHTERNRMRAVPAEAQVPVVVSGCFGSFYTDRAVWFGCWGGGGVLLGLGGGGGCFLWGAVVAAGGFFFTRLRLLLAFLGCFCCFFSSSGWWCTIGSLLRFRWLTACLKECSGLVQIYRFIMLHIYNTLTYMNTLNTLQISQLTQYTSLLTVLE